MYIIFYAQTFSSDVLPRSGSMWCVPVNTAVIWHLGRGWQEERQQASWQGSSRIEHIFTECRHLLGTCTSPLVESSLRSVEREELRGAEEFHYHSLLPPSKLIVTGWFFPCLKYRLYLLQFHLCGLLCTLISSTGLIMWYYYSWGDVILLFYLVGVHIIFIQFWHLYPYFYGLKSKEKEAQNLAKNELRTWR